MLQELAKIISLRGGLTLHFRIIVFLPASLRTICLYCQFVSCSMSPPSVRITVRRGIYLVLGCEFPDLFSHEITLHVMSGWRNISHIVHTLYIPQVYSVLLFLVGLISTCRMSTFRAYFCSPFSCSPAFIKSIQLSWRCCPYPVRLCVKFSWSKTIQFGQRVLELPLV